MTANPFTYGNPISAPTRFFGRKAEVEQVYTRLLNADWRERMEDMIWALMNSPEFVFVP